MIIPTAPQSGFPTDVENMGGALQNLMGGGGAGDLSQYMGEHGGGGLKYCQKIPLKEFIW